MPSPISQSRYFPIILLVYNRPELAQKTIASLAANTLAAQSDLWVFSDGPKNQADSKKVEATRKVVKQVSGFKNIHLVEREKNRGLANSVISAVTELLSSNRAVIVVEDDVDLSPCFLRFMNDALTRHMHEERIISIGSWTYFCPKGAMGECFFLRYPDSIAWGTFSRAWNLFEPKASKLQAELESSGKLNALDEKNCSGLKKMLVNQIEGRVDSWAIRWTASAVLHNKLTFYPSQNLANHLGAGPQATHCKSVSKFDTPLPLADTCVQLENIPICESKQALKLWTRFFTPSPLTSVLKRAKRFFCVKSQN